MFKEFDAISYMLHPYFGGEGIDSNTERQFENWRMAWRRYYGVDIDGQENTLNGILVNGVIAPLDRFYIPIRLEDMRIKYRLYTDLTFYANDVVSFPSQLPNRHKIIDGKEVNVIGDPIVIEGKMVLKLLNTHIPILVDCDLRQIPYEDLTFL